MGNKCGAVEKLQDILNAVVPNASLAVYTVIHHAMLSSKVANMECVFAFVKKSLKSFMHVI
jgi:mannose/fructose/N-acetylgalactosamine-specific phosphotransferase system component IID